MFAFELEFLKWLEGLRTSFLNVFFEGITILGEETLTLFVLLLAVLFVHTTLKTQVKITEKARD